MMLNDQYRKDLAVEIAEYTKELPFECQELILTVAKSMDFAVRCAARQVKPDRTAETVCGAKIVPAGA
jgi:hypothetical protein